MSRYHQFCNFSVSIANLSSLYLLTTRLQANLNFWKTSMKSLGGGGRDLILNIPSEKIAQYIHYKTMYTLFSNIYHCIKSIMIWNEIWSHKHIVDTNCLNTLSINACEKSAISLKGLIFFLLFLKSFWQIGRRNKQDNNDNGKNTALKMNTLEKGYYEQE